MNDAELHDADFVQRLLGVKVERGPGPGEGKM